MRVFSKALLQKLGGFIEFKTEGSHSFYLPQRTKAKLTLVGSGQDSSWMDIMGTALYNAGSGGGLFVGCAILPAGPYSVTIEKSVEEPSSIGIGGGTIAPLKGVTLTNTTGDLISVKWDITTSYNFDIVAGTVEHEDTGNNPNEDGTGGNSLYNGYGKGADKRAHNNTLGYFKLEFV